jgi:hypothetical protein
MGAGNARVRRELERAARLLRELAEERAVDAEAVREALRRVEALLDAAEGRDALELEVEMWPGSHGSDFAVTEGEVVVETVSREDYGEGFVKRVRLVPLTDRAVVQYYATFEPGPRAFGAWREVRTWYVYERGKGWRVEKTEERTGWDELERAEEAALEEPEL